MGEYDGQPMAAARDRSRARWAEMGFDGTYRVCRVESRKKVTDQGNSCVGRCPEKDVKEKKGVEACVENQG